MTIRIQSATVVQRARNILFSRLDDELLAIDGEESYCYSLNESAGRAWDLIIAPMSVEAVCVQLCREYKVDRETCKRDIIELFQGLCKAGLVKVCDGV